MCAARRPRAESDVGDFPIVDIPDTHYARSGDVYIAYQVFGAGPFDLVIVPGALSNITYGWEYESLRIVGKS